MGRFSDYAKRLEREGKNNTQITKALRQEYALHNKHAMKSGDFIKKNWLEYGKKDAKTELRQTIRKYDPTYISLTAKSRAKTPEYFREVTLRTRPDFRQDPTGKTTIDEYIVSHIKTNKELKEANLKFSKDFKRESNNLRNRFKRAGKEVDISRITTKFDGEKKSLVELYDMRMTARKKEDRARITRRINRIFNETKKIKADMIRKTNRKIIGFSEEKLRDGQLLEALEGTFDVETTDNNGNIVHWALAGSDPQVIYSFSIYKHEGEIIHIQHEAQLEEYGVSLTESQSVAQLEIFHQY